MVLCGYQFQLPIEIMERQAYDDRGLGGLRLDVEGSTTLQVSPGLFSDFRLRVHGDISTRLRM